jgi:hypothetical protein
MFADFIQRPPSVQGTDSRRMGRAKMPIGRKFRIRRTESENLGNADMCHPLGTSRRWMFCPIFSSRHLRSKVFVSKNCEALTREEIAARQLTFVRAENGPQNRQC